MTVERTISYPAHQVGSYPVYEGGIYFQIRCQCTRGGFWEFVRDFETLIPNQEKHGERLIGAWRTLYGEYHEIIHLYFFENFAEMERIRSKLFSDPKKLEEIKGDTSPNPPHYWLYEGDNRFMVLLPYSPPIKPQHPEKVIQFPAGMVGSYPASSDGQVYLYETVRAGRAGFWDWVRNFQKGLPILQKHGHNLVGAWRTIYGGTYFELINLYAFESLAGMEKARQSLYADPDYLELGRQDTSPDQPRYWTRGESARIMVPLPYSLMK